MTEKTTQKAAPKRGRASTKQQLEEMQTNILEAMTQAVGQLEDKFQSQIDEMKGQMNTPAPKGMKVIETNYDPADLIETAPPTEEEIATWTPEQVKEFNEKEVKKMRARKQAQQAKRAQFDSMSTSQRRQAMRQERDPNIIRIAVDPDYDGDDYVRVQCLRRVGLGDGETSDINEVVDMPRHQAKRLQETGVIRIAL